MSTTAEIRAELNGLVFGRISMADGVVAPLIFVVANRVWGLSVATVAGISVAAAITMWRLLRGKRIRFAVSGLLGTGLAAAFALRSGSAEDFFLPGIISGAVTTLAILLSIGVRRPFVAWTSWLTRGWPLEWYWHPSVRPAYTRASWMWATFFFARTVVQWQLYRSGESGVLAVARVALGWPALLALLILTYVFGRRWLGSLGGPSVAEYEAGSDRPWVGQTAGF